MASSAAGGIANAATRSVITGTDFGDNLIAVLPDIIASTVGAVIGEALAGTSNKGQTTGGTHAHPEGAAADMTAETQSYLQSFGATIEIVDGQPRVTNPADLKLGTRVIPQSGGGSGLSVELVADGSYSRIDDYQYFLDTAPNDTQRHEGVPDLGGVIYTSDTPNASQPTSLALMVNGNVSLRLFINGGIAIPYAGGIQRVDPLGYTVGYGAEPKPHSSLAEFNYGHPEFAAALFSHENGIKRSDEAVWKQAPYGWEGYFYRAGGEARAGLNDAWHDVTETIWPTTPERAMQNGYTGNNPFLLVGKILNLVAEPAVQGLAALVPRSEAPADYFADKAAADTNAKYPFIFDQRRVQTDQQWRENVAGLLLTAAGGRLFPKAGGGAAAEGGLAGGTFDLGVSGSQYTLKAPTIAGFEGATGTVNTRAFVAHGNSAASLRPATLYELYAKDGTFLKNGITQNLDTRYSRTFMADKDIFPIASGPRADMLALERQRTLANPGPLNLESWAVKARAEALKR